MDYQQVQKSWEDGLSQIQSNHQRKSVRVSAKVMRLGCRFIFQQDNDPKNTVAQNGMD